MYFPSSLEDTSSIEQQPIISTFEPEPFSPSTTTKDNDLSSFLQPVKYIVENSNSNNSFDFSDTNNGVTSSEQHQTTNTSDVLKSLANNLTAFVPSVTNDIFFSRQMFDALDPENKTFLTTTSININNNTKKSPQQTFPSQRRASVGSGASTNDSTFERETTTTITQTPSFEIGRGSKDLRRNKLSSNKDKPLRNRGRPTKVFDFVLDATKVLDNREDHFDICSITYQTPVSDQDMEDAERLKDKQIPKKTHPKKNQNGQENEADEISPIARPKSTTSEAERLREAEKQRRKEIEEQKKLEQERIRQKEERMKAFQKNRKDYTSANPKTINELTTNHGKFIASVFPKVHDINNKHFKQRVYLATHTTAPKQFRLAMPDLPHNDEQYKELVRKSIEHLAQFLKNLCYPSEETTELEQMRNEHVGLFFADLVTKLVGKDVEVIIENSMNPGFSGKRKSTCDRNDRKDKPISTAFVKHYDGPLIKPGTSFDVSLFFQQTGDNNDTSQNIQSSWTPTATTANNTTSWLTNNPIMRTSTTQKESIVQSLSTASTESVTNHLAGVQEYMPPTEDLFENVMKTTVQNVPSIQNPFNFSYPAAQTKSYLSTSINFDQTMTMQQNSNHFQNESAASKFVPFHFPTRPKIPVSTNPHSFGIWEDVPTPENFSLFKNNKSKGVKDASHQQHQNQSISQQDEREGGNWLFSENLRNLLLNTFNDFYAGSKSTKSSRYNSQTSSINHVKTLMNQTANNNDNNWLFTEKFRSQLRSILSQQT